MPGRAGSSSNLFSGVLPTLNSFFIRTLVQQDSGFGDRIISQVLISTCPRLRAISTGPNLRQSSWLSIRSKTATSNGCSSSRIQPIHAISSLRIEPWTSFVIYFHSRSSSSFPPISIFGSCTSRARRTSWWTPSQGSNSIEFEPFTRQRRSMKFNCPIASKNRV